MSLDRKDFEMVGVSIPTVDWWSARDEIDRLTDTALRK